MRRGGGCGTLSMAAITFENDAHIVVFKTVVSIIDFDSSVWTKPCYTCFVYVVYQRYIFKRSIWWLY